MAEVPHVDELLPLWKDVEAALKQLKEEEKRPTLGWAMAWRAVTEAQEALSEAFGPGLSGEGLR